MKLSFARPFATVLPACLLLGCVAPLAKATLLSNVDAMGHCQAAARSQMCAPVQGASMVSELSLALLDLQVLAGGTSGSDRSAEMGAGAASANLSEAIAIVVSPQMFSSIQLSFDPRFDLTGSAAERRFATQSALRMNVPGLEASRVELTLGTAMTGFEDKAVGQRTLAKTSYVSFSLVNQLHAGRAVRLVGDYEQDPDEETEIVLQ
jgi:hypothetical protein